MSEIVKDEMVKPMDKAVWNVEHVIKFSKWGHLHYHGHDISLRHYYGTMAMLILPVILILLCGVLVFIHFKTIMERISILYATNRFNAAAKPKSE